MTIWLLKVDSDINFSYEELYATKNSAMIRLNELLRYKYPHNQLLMELDHSISYIEKYGDHFIFITLQERVVEQ